MTRATRRTPAPAARLLRLALACALAVAFGGCDDGGNDPPEDLLDDASVEDTDADTQPDLDADTDTGTDTSETGDTAGGTDLDATAPSDADMLDIVDGTSDGATDGGLDADAAPDAEMVETCGGIECLATELCCDDVCVDPASSDAHCGACANACAPSEGCVAGECSCGSTACALGDTCCSPDACIDLGSNPNHCGACGNACGAGEVCLSGTCACPRVGGGLEVCGASETCCANDGCRLLDVDPQSCGACGVTCGAGELCIGGTCNCGPTSATGQVCAAGEACCGSPGACLPDDDATCDCGTQLCGSGEACCPLPSGGGDACASTWRENTNCGACGVTCGVGEFCQSATCICSPGRGDCDGDPNNGCERVLGVDSMHCGACGTTCPAGSVCNGAGECTVVCQPGLVECGGECVNLGWNRAHCGACNNACPPGEVANGGGVCAATCLPGLEVCDEQCVDLDTNNFYCGDCNTACGPGQVCDGSGQCALTCLPGRNLCAGECVDFGSDIRNCGSCGNVCPTGRVCNGFGQCEITCAPGRTQCNGQCVDFDRDRFNCGACDNRCATGEQCVDGACGVECPPGQTSCNGICRDLQANRLHCGACGAACDVTEACVMGACSSICPSNTVPCNGMCVLTASDAANCGACGFACAAGEVCRTGDCCTAGVDCDPPPAQIATGLWAGNATVCAQLERTSTDPMTMITTTERPLFCWGDDTAFGVLDATGVESRRAVRPAPSLTFVGTDPENTVLDMAIGDDVACATTQDALWCWGSNQQGQLGNGTIQGGQVQPPSIVGSWGSLADVFDSAVTDVSVGLSSNCAVTASGLLYCWGSIPPPGIPLNLTPTIVPVPGVFVEQVALAKDLACVVGVSGGDRGVWCVGETGAKLGCGQTTCPEQLAWAPVHDDAGLPLVGVRSVAIGKEHGCAALDSGATVCWGKGNVGQLGNCGASGTNPCTSGNESTGAIAVPPTGLDLTYVSDLAVGAGISDAARRTCAVLSDGSVTCWGSNSKGEAGSQCPTSEPACVSVVLGEPALVEMGPGLALGSVVDVALAGAFSCALTTDGAVLCWGDNLYGGLGNGNGGGQGARGYVDLPGDGDLVAISVGFACARVTDATLTESIWCWGDGEAAEPRQRSLGTTLVGFDTSEAGDRMIGADTNGDLVLWQEGELGPLAVWPNIGGLSAYTGGQRPIDDVQNGGNWFCVRRTTGEVECAGAPPTGGTLGDAAGTTTSMVPVQVQGMDGTLAALDLAVGDRHACVLVDTMATGTSGGIRCWGDNGQGQVGDGTGVDAPQPVQVVGFDGSTASTSAIDLDTDRNTTCAVTADGAVWCWGDNQAYRIDPFGPLGAVLQPLEIEEFGPGLRTAVQVSVGGQHTCVLDDTGQPWCWGTNFAGAITPEGEDILLPFALALAPGEVATRVEVDGTVIFVELSDGRIRASGPSQNAMLGTRGGAWTAVPQPAEFPTP